MLRKIAYWGATGLVGIVTLFAGFSYLTAAPEAVENFRHVGSPAVACPAGHREAGRSHRAVPATVAGLEGMGLRRLYLHVDRGSRGALSGWRRGLVLAARRVARVAGGFVRHALGESRRFCEGDAGVAAGPQYRGLTHAASGPTRSLRSTASRTARRAPLDGKARTVRRGARASLLLPASNDD